MTERQLLMPALSSLGLSAKEQEFYFAALELGSAPVAAVSQRAGITRTSAYDVIARLEKEGLISYAEVRGIKHVIAEDPGVLIDRWNRMKVMIDDAVPELRAMQSQGSSKPTTRFCPGKDGIMHLLQMTLECKRLPLIGILSMHELFEVPGEREMNKIVAERIRRGISLRVLRSRSRDMSKIWPPSKDEFREQRYVPEGIDLGMTMYVCDDSVIYISSKQESYGLLISSRDLAELNRQMFNGLWEISA